MTKEELENLKPGTLILFSNGYKILLLQKHKSFSTEYVVFRYLTSKNRICIRPLYKELFSNDCRVLMPERG